MLLILAQARARVSHAHAPAIVPKRSTLAKITYVIFTQFATE